MTASCACGIAVEVLDREPLKSHGTAYEEQFYQGRLKQSSGRHPIQYGTGAAHGRSVARAVARISPGSLPGWQTSFGAHASGARARRYTHGSPGLASAKEPPPACPGFRALRVWQVNRESSCSPRVESENRADNFRVTIHGKLLNVPSKIEAYHDSHAMVRKLVHVLTRWRMLLAGDKLVNSSDPISVIAPSLGYGSESAFSTAFKRVKRSRPRQSARTYRRLICAVGGRQTIQSLLQESPPRVATATASPEEIVGRHEIAENPVRTPEVCPRIAIRRAARPKPGVAGPTSSKVRAARESSSRVRVCLIRTSLGHEPIRTI
jgi:AraC-like DNA-binding protein